MLSEKLSQIQPNVCLNQIRKSFQLQSNNQLGLRVLIRIPSGKEQIYFPPSPLPTEIESKFPVIVKDQKIVQYHFPPPPLFFLRTFCSFWKKKKRESFLGFQVTAAYFRRELENDPTEIDIRNNNKKEKETK